MGGGGGDAETATPGLKVSKKTRRGLKIIKLTSPTEKHLNTYNAHLPTIRICV